MELVSSSVRVTLAKFQQGVGGTETGINKPYILIICFYFYPWKFLFLLSKNLSSCCFFLLSKLVSKISNFSFYSRNSRSKFQISLSILETRDQNVKFLFLLSTFEIRISNFSFYSRNSRSKFQISRIYFFDSRQCLLWALTNRREDTVVADMVADKKNWSTWSWTWWPTWR